MKTLAGITATLLALLALAACATRQPLRGQETKGLDRKLSTFAYIEEGDLVSFIVDTKATRYRGTEAYLPIEVCVANRGLKTLTVTRESFTLADASGNRYPCASPRELMQGYDFLDLDRRLLELEGIVFNRFANFVRYQSKFSPTRLAPSVPGQSSIVQERVVLPEFGYMIDLLYFPTPKAGISGVPLELFLAAPQLQDPVFVKFEVK